MKVYLMVNLVTFVTLVWPVIGQWSGGNPVSPPRTIRVNVGSRDVRPAAVNNVRPVPDLAPDVPQTNPPETQVDVRNSGRMPAAPGFYRRMFTPYFLDEIWSDKVCGMSRRMMSARGNQFNPWGFGMFGSNMFRCNCQMFGGETFELGQVDNSPDARRDCMTTITGVLCCLS